MNGKTRRNVDEIKRVVVKCKICKDVIEYEGDVGFVHCECGKCGVDCIESVNGGNAYIKVIATPDVRDILEIEYKDIREC